ncbi:hypothetical protein U3516DRAFT_739054 [Neocallimastix sp. 'constans']
MKKTREEKKKLFSSITNEHITSCSNDVKDSSKKNNNTSNSSCSRTTKNYINIINEDNNTNNINESVTSALPQIPALDEEEKEQRLIPHYGFLNSEIIEHLTKYIEIHLLKDNPFEISKNTTICFVCNCKKWESLYTRMNKLLQNIVINKIILRYNNDIDGEKLEEEGTVIQNSKYRKSTQGKAYYDCYYNNYIKYNWIAFFSIDEFLTRLFGENKKLFYENKPIIESFLSKNNFKYSKGVKSIIKFKYYNYELLNGNKAPVIANFLEINIFNNAENQKCCINTLGFNDYIDKHLYYCVVKESNNDQYYIKTNKIPTKEYIYGIPARERILKPNSLRGMLEI